MEKDIKNVDTEKEVVETDGTNVYPQAKQYVELKIHEALKKEFENMKYEFLELKNSLNKKDETEKETKVEPLNNIDNNWTI